MTNDSKIAQRELVVLGVARRGGRIVAAGRAIVPLVKPGKKATVKVDVTVAYAGGAYRVTASLLDGRLRVERVQRAASIDPVPPELLVGPVRISNLERPARPAQ